MIFEKLLSQIKEPEPSLFSLACILLHCVLAREHGSCAHSRSFPQNPQKQEIRRITTTTRILKLEALEMNEA